MKEGGWREDGRRRKARNKEVKSQGVEGGLKISVMSAV